MMVSYCGSPLQPAIAAASRLMRSNDRLISSLWFDQSVDAHMFDVEFILEEADDLIIRNAGDQKRCGHLHIPQEFALTTENAPARRPGRWRDLISFYPAEVLDPDIAAIILDD